MHVLNFFIHLCFCSLRRDDNGIVFKTSTLKPVYKNAHFQAPESHCRVSEQPKCIKKSLFLVFRMVLYKSPATDFLLSV